MKRIIINWENMSDYSSVPIEYRFVDSANVIPGKEAWGCKAVSSLDWFFKFHFPGNPVMPGVLVMETLQQTGLLIITTKPEIEEKIMLFNGCENMRMFNSVRPGDILKTHVICDSFRRGVAKFHGEVHLERNGGEKQLLVCTMNFTMLLRSKMVLMPNQYDKLPDICIGRGGRLIDYRNIDQFLADPIEYRFIDSAILKENISIGTKNISYLDWYQSLYDLIMPIGFIMESIMQTGVLIVTQNDNIQNPLMMFNDCEVMNIYSDVHPGDSLKTYVTLNSFRNGIGKFEGYAFVDKKLVCQMKFKLIHPDELKKFSNRLAGRLQKNDA